jgi:integrase
VWRGMILFGLYTGQRLGDIAKLTWQNIDLANDDPEVRFVSRKTKKPQSIPLGKPLIKFLEGSDAGDDPKQPLFPKSFVAAAKKVGTLSNQFHDILSEVGLVEQRTHAGTGKGRSNRRQLHELSFHSLRHTTTSLMKNAGVSPAIVQDIIGHESAEISAHYTHIEDASKRRAIDSLPDVTGSGHVSN